MDYSEPAALNDICTSQPWREFENSELKISIEAVNTEICDILVKKLSNNNNSSGKKCFHKLRRTLIYIIKLMTMKIT